MEKRWTREAILELLREPLPPRPVTVNDPVVIGAEDWALLEAEARAKDERSDRSAWTRRWNPHFNLLGLVGEWHFGNLCGLPRHRGFGDGGHDFPGIDVKATSHYDLPRLLRHQDDLLRASYYALVAVSLPTHTCRYVGYATRDQLQGAPCQEYGYGPTRTLLPEHLCPDLPTE